MKAAILTLGDNSYHGYTTGLTWNGWQCPLFDAVTAEEILNDICSDPDMCMDWVYNGKLDAFICDENEYKGIDVEVEGEFRRLYPIGAFAWAWQIDEDITK